MAEVDGGSREAESPAGRERRRIRFASINWLGALAYGVLPALVLVLGMAAGIAKYVVGSARGRGSTHRSAPCGQGWQRRDSVVSGRDRRTATGGCGQSAHGPVPEFISRADPRCGDSGCRTEAHLRRCHGACGRGRFGRYSSSGGVGIHRPGGSCRHRCSDRHGVLGASDSGPCQRYVADFRLRPRIAPNGSTEGSGE